MWDDECGLRFAIHTVVSALVVLAVLGAFAMWTYDPAVTTDTRAMIERMAP